MADFCVDCLNKLEEAVPPKPKSAYILSKELELCEECGQYKHIVIVERKYYWLRKLRIVLFPFKAALFLLSVLWNLLTFPYRVWKRTH